MKINLDTKKRKYESLFGNQFNKKYTPEVIEQFGDEMFEWFKIKENIWLKDFAINKVISRQRFSEFEKKNKYFAEIYSICKDMQESKFVKLGLSKQVNSALPIFALKQLGWRDSIEHIGKDGKDLINKIEIEIVTKKD